MLVLLLYVGIVRCVLFSMLSVDVRILCLSAYVLCAGLCILRTSVAISILRTSVAICILRTSISMPVICGSLSLRHDAFSVCGWRNGPQYGVHPQIY